MADVHTSEQRSYNMSQIRGKNTKPELTLRRELYARGLRGYRVKAKLPGKPDIVYSKHKLAIFVDGCFWHKCPKCFIEPRTRRKFWMKKINGNIRRDEIVNRELEETGWRVLRFWEHDVNKDPGTVVENIRREISKR